MSKDKIINIDPNKREMEKSLDEMKEFVNSLTPESYRGIYILATLQDPDNPLDYTIYRAAAGVDWELCGIIRSEVERMNHWYYSEVIGENDYSYEED